MKLNKNATTKFKNMGWLLLERGVGVLIAFFVMTLVARHLGPAGFGAYAYLFGLSALFLPIVQFGLDAVLMRDLSRSTTDQGLTLGSALIIQMVGAGAAFSLALGFVAIFGGPKHVTVALMAIAGLHLLVFPSEVLNTWFKAREQMAWVVLPRIAVALLIGVVAFLLVRQNAPLDHFVTLRGAEFVALAIVAIAAFLISPGRLWSLRADRQRCLGLLREGWPLALSAVAIAIYLRVDQVMLGQMSPAQELGYYSIAVRISDVALIVPVALRTSLFASIVRAFDRGEAELARYEQHVYDAMVIASLVTMVGLAAGTMLLFVPVFGVAYQPGLPMVLILLLSLPWVGLGLARSAVLVARKWLWTAPVATSIGAIVNIALNLVFIPRFGGVGAAWATVISYWLAAYGTCFLLPYLHPMGAKMTRALNPISASQRLLRKFKGGEDDEAR